jgi:hypothetical protein
MVMLGAVAVEWHIKRMGNLGSEPEPEPEGHQAEPPGAPTGPLLTG